MAFSRHPPALPTRFKRVRGGNQLVSYELLVGEDGRIAAKHESVAGRASYFIYEYDPDGHLLRAWRDGKLAEEYAYDPKGARIASWNLRQGQWKYGYDDKGRLTAAGPWGFSYAEDGSLREAWTPERSFFLGYNQEGGLSRIVLPGGQVLRSESVAPGLPTEKYLDAVPVESLTWRSPLQLATFRDLRAGTRMQFHHTGQGRLPQAVTVQTPQGAANYLLGYDQVGSLKAVAAMDGENEGRVVKVVDYDAFGNILADSNPGLFMPLSFAGGLRDRFTGLVRFCHRDYDPTVGRFTAPDPLGDTGGDHDLYDYCVDEPVGRIDPEGLWGIALESSASAGAGVYPLTDTKSKGASIGSFLEYVPESDSGKDAHGVNAGMYKTQSEGDIAGAKAGFGYSLTLLKRPAEEVLQGDSRYSTHTLGPLSFTTYANPETGEEQAWGIGFGGKGTGLAVEGGTSTGVIAGKDVKP